jgi:hypothetical protein
MYMLLCKWIFYPETEFMNVHFRWDFWELSWEYSDLMFSYKMFTIQTSFKPFCSRGGGGGVKSVRRGDCE